MEIDGEMEMEIEEEMEIKKGRKGPRSAAGFVLQGEKGLPRRSFGSGRALGRAAARQANETPVKAHCE